MPTIDNPGMAIRAGERILDSYAGAIELAIVANGSSPASLEALWDFTASRPGSVHVLEEPKNLGYGVGCNIGLGFLLERGGFDYFGVANDDILPARKCLDELAGTILELERLGHNPGMVGPVSNFVNGAQVVDIGAYEDETAMEALAENWYATKRESATQTIQLRGLLALIAPKCLETIGGFDPVFGIGNFEDDDLNLRAKLAGFTAWIADGAFVHHEGSLTFRSLNIDYSANIERNMRIFLRKWRLSRIEDWPLLDSVPEGVDLYSPLGKPNEPHKHVVRVNGEPVDLVRQATDLEFAAWVMGAIADRPDDARLAVIEAIEALPRSA